jgi:hypothetical protein
MTLTLIADSARSKFKVSLRKTSRRWCGNRCFDRTKDINSDIGALQKKIQRAETEDRYSLMYELPGGGAEPEDET